MKKIMLSLLSVCLLVWSTTTATDIKDICQNVENQVIGVDIIQEKKGSKVYLVQGESCGEVKISVIQTNGTLMTESETISEQHFSWSFETSQWPPGQYLVIVESLTPECQLKKTIELGK